MELLKQLIILNVLAAVAAETLWDCPGQCHCAWEMGKKLANCSYAGLSEIPTVSPEIQILNLTGNPLSEISRSVSMSGAFYNLLKLLLRDCKLTKIHRRGLHGMDILIQLDLSKNYLTTLRNDTFEDMSNIRWISLNDNQLEKLEDGLFRNLRYLKTVDLSNNQIFQIGVSCFSMVPQLTNIKLDNNSLEYLKLDTINTLSSLSSLELNDNPWRCDCKLQPLRDWVMSKNLFAAHDNVTCADPANLHGKSWKDLDANDFACQPDIEVIVPTTENVQATASVPTETSATNITLTCQVNGNPLPEFHWSPNSQWEVKYYICGDYLCMSRGVEERVVKLSKAQSPSPVVNKD